MSKRIIEGKKKTEVEEDRFKDMSPAARLKYDQSHDSTGMSLLLKRLRSGEQTLFVTQKEDRYEEWATEAFYEHQASLTIGRREITEDDVTVEGMSLADCLRGESSDDPEILTPSACRVFSDQTLLTIKSIYDGEPADEMFRAFMRSHPRTKNLHFSQMVTDAHLRRDIEETSLILKIRGDMFQKSLENSTHDRYLRVPEGIQNNRKYSIRGDAFCRTNSECDCDLMLVDPSGKSEMIDGNMTDEEKRQSVVGILQRWNEIETLGKSNSDLTEELLYTLMIDRKIHLDPMYSCEIKWERENCNHDGCGCRIKCVGRGTKVIGVYYELQHEGSKISSFARLSSLIYAWIVQGSSKKEELDDLPRLHEPRIDCTLVLTKRDFLSMPDKRNDLYVRCESCRKPKCNCDGNVILCPPESLRVFLDCFTQIWYNSSEKKKQIEKKYGSVTNPIVMVMQQFVKESKDEKFESGDRQASARYKANMIRSVLNLRIPRKSRCLDYGAGDGIFAAEMARIVGCTVYCYDENRKKGYLSKQELKGKWDVIFFLQVLHHVRLDGREEVHKFFADQRLGTVVVLQEHDVSTKYDAAAVDFAHMMYDAPRVGSLSELLGEKRNYYNREKVLVFFESAGYHESVITHPVGPSNTYYALLVKRT